MDVGIDRTRASAPPPALLQSLTTANVPISVGHSIVDTVRPHEVEVLAAIRDAGLEHQVIFSKEAVMVLPSGVNKATGLLEALKELGVVPGQTIGIGDAENETPSSSHADWRLRLTTRSRP